MKSYIICAVIAITTVAACKKSDSPKEEILPEPRTVSVLEKSTNRPIAGAKVLIQVCTYYDLVLGCTSYATAATLTTNSLGQVTFTPPEKFESIEVEHPDYFATEEASNVVNITLIPKVVVKAVIKKVNTYSFGDILHLEIRQEGCYSYTCLSRSYQAGTAGDTVAYFEGQGYTSNQVSWYINYLTTDVWHPEPPFFINGFDTATINIEY